MEKIETSGNRLREAFANRDADVPVRLNKFLAEAGICSRREADRLIAAGQVTVDGLPAQMGQTVLASQEIKVGETQAAREKEMVFLAVNKPRGVVCTTEKKWGDVTIEEFLHYPKRVFSVGRLDKESEGLLLMTNDGELQNRIMRAANFHEKEYEVTVDRLIDEKFLNGMRRGVFLKELNVTTRACTVRKTGRRKFSIILTQGLNRQIRRMCQAFGYQVLALKRVRIMNIYLGDLPTGAIREITDAEMEEMYEILQTGNDNRKTQNRKERKPIRGHRNSKAEP